MKSVKPQLHSDQTCEPLHHSDSTPINAPFATTLRTLEDKLVFGRPFSYIANQFGHVGHASAAKFAEGRGATTSRVSKHVAPSADSQAEACPN